MMPVRSYRVDVKGYSLAIDAGVKGLGWKPDYVMITHYHWDHTMGLYLTGSVKACMSRRTIEAIERRSHIKHIVQSAMEAGIPRDLIESNPLFHDFAKIYDSLRAWLDRADVYEMEDCPPVKEGLVDPIPCPGHTEDHTCFLIGVALFAGDHYLEGENPITYDAFKYIQSTARILSSKWSILYPGHGVQRAREHAASRLAEIAASKTRRMMVVASLLSSGWKGGLKQLAEAVYGVSDDMLTSYLRVSNIAGYIRGLESLGVFL